MDKNRDLEVINQEASPTEKTSFRNCSPWKKQLLIVGTVVLLTAAFIMAGIYLMKRNYNTAKQDTYNGFYQTAYNFAEQQNHVSNYALISVDAAREVSRLEVLSVSDSEFVIKNADKNDRTISWLEVQGTGVFTVDLAAGEFITDPERQYVLVRVPRPVLTECKVSGTGKQFLKRADFLIFNGSVAEGVQLSQNQLKEGRIKLEDAMRQDRRFYDESQKAAVSMIESLVKQWNPSVPDLQVEVEFIESN